jgi:transposase InsO family protein
MVKRKFEQELDEALGSSSLSHLVPEKVLAKKKKLPLPPKIGDRPIVDMKLSWNDSPEVTVRVMLDCGANIPVISQELVEKHKVPGVLRTKACGFYGFDGEESGDAGRAYTLPCTLRLKDHYTQESFEISPLQDDHDILLPWWWITKHPIKYVHTGDPADIKFVSQQCVNCTADAAAEFTIEYDDSVAYFEKDQEVIGVLGSLRFDDDEQVVIDMEESQLQGIPYQYHAFKSVYNGQYSDELPPHRSFDHAIDLVEGKEPPWGPIYALSEKELGVLREYLDEMLKSGKIRPSKSPAGAPILFVPKKEGRGLRLCVDYRGLNKVTILNRYPLPLMNELRDRVRSAKIFTKLDLKSGYNLIRIKEGDEWKTAFRSRYGHYEYKVMPFGLANAPATFQNMMNEVFRDMIDMGVVIYLDDILIYSESEDDHVELVKKVLARLQEHQLAIAPEKCDWHQSKVNFLGYIISAEGIEMDQEKIKTVLEWEPPGTVKEVQSFLGFANFYRRFIEGYSKLTRPLTDLTKKSEKFKWSENCQLVFEELKKRFTSAPILRHFDPDLACIIECDASDFAIGAILSQDFDARLHPVAFHSRKMNKHEINYEIHDKELLAITSAFKEWRRYLEGARHKINVFTDHRGLEWFAQNKPLNRRQARWALELDGFDFQIIYRPGVKNGKPDALSRRAEHRPEKGGHDYQPVEHVLKPGQWVPESYREQRVRPTEEHEILLSSVQMQGLRPVVKMAKDVEQEIIEKAADDLIWQDLYEKARAEGRIEGQVRDDITCGNGMLYRKGKIWIPRDQALKKLIFESEHDSMVAGHMGMDKTVEMIGRNFYWPGMAEEIEDYVRSCDDCQRNKASRHKRHGTLHPLELSYSPWDSISMDFITQLPESNGCTTVWVVVDRFTKMAHFIPIVKGQKTAENCAKLFLANVWRAHGLPSDIVSDRDAVFTGAFWSELTKRLGVRLRMSTAFRPQTDGQTERINQTLEQYLRQFCNYEQNDWCDMLPLAEYSYNNSVTTATQMSPFYANYGFHPRTTWPVEVESKNPASKVYSHWVESVHELCRSYLENTKERMGRYYDRSKKAAPLFEPGDLVMLNGKNIRTRRAAKKLDNKLFGPFKVVKLVGRGGMSVELELPKRWRVHNVFHTSLLEKYRTSAKGIRDPPVAVTDVKYVDKYGVEHDVGYDVDGQQVLEDFVVDEVMSSQYDTDRKKVLYLIKWEGYPEQSDWTEEPLEHLPRALVRAFHKRHPEAAMDAKLAKKATKR